MPARCKAIDSKLLLARSDRSCEVVKAHDSDVEERGNQAAAHHLAASCSNQLNSIDIVESAAPQPALGDLCRSPSSETSHCTAGSESWGQGSSSFLPHVSARGEHEGLAILSRTEWGSYDDARASRLNVSFKSQSPGSAASHVRSAYPRLFNLRRSPPATTELHSQNKANLYLDQQIAMFEENQRQRRHLHRSKSTCAQLDLPEPTRQLERKDCHRQFSVPLQVNIPPQKSIGTKSTNETELPICAQPAPTNACECSQPRCQRDFSLCNCPSSQPEVEISCQPTCSDMSNLALKIKVAEAAADFALMYTDAAHLVMEKAPSRVLRDSSTLREYSLRIKTKLP